MSHKQAKKARKGNPTLHPNFKREGRRLHDEAMALATIRMHNAAADRRAREKVDASYE